MIDEVRIIDIPKITAPDGRGNLSVVEKETLPYAIKRVYYLYDVPSNSTRGGHAHIKMKQCLIALSGSFTVVVDDGIKKKEILLNRPDKGLLIPNGIWRKLIEFSAGAVCLSLVSEEYDKADYVRNYEDFLTLKRK